MLELSGRMLDLVSAAFLHLQQSIAFTEHPFVNFASDVAQLSFCCSKKSGFKMENIMPEVFL